MIVLLDSNINSTSTSFCFDNDNPNDSIDEIKKIIKDQEEIVLFCNYWVQSGGSNSLKSILDVYEVRTFIESCSNLTIILYSWQVERKYNIYSDFEYYNNIYILPEITILELSIILKKIDSNLENVKHLLCDIINNYKTDQGYLSKSNLNLNKFLYLYNSRWDDFKIGTISFIEPVNIGDEYAIDSPQKSYYNEMNTVLKKKKYIDFLKEPKNEMAFVYFQMKLENNSIKVYANNDSVLNNGKFDFWVSSLYFAIYYKNGLTINDTGYKLDSTEITIVKKKNELNNPDIELYWFYHSLHYSFLEQNGFLNFTLYRENKIVNNCDIHKKAIELFATNYPHLEPKILETLTPYYLKEWKKISINNSISKVMARNQSHNIGSHVLSRMVQPDDIDIFNILLGRKPKYLPIGKSLREQVKTEVNKLSNSKSSCNFSQKRKAYSEEQKKYYNKLISYFFSYLKTRQDLLADIVSGVPQVQSAKLFKKEVLKGIDDNRLLLNRISGVEDFKYRFKIEIAKSLGDDVAMAFANDIMGQHAFYIILENIIRNTAKHGASKSQKEEYVFTICVKESEIDPTHYQISIYDDIKIEGDTYLKLKTDLGIFKPESSIEFNDETIKINDVDILITKICENNAFEAKNDATNEFTNAFLKRANDYPDELEYLGSKDEYDYFKISKIDHLVTLQNIWINKKILDEDTFDLRQQALGLIEMETCTAYLRRIEISKIQAPEFLLEFDKQGKEKLVEAIKKGEKKLRLLRAVRPLKKENGNKEYEKYLGYRFYIPKPKELLIIDEIGDLWDKCLEKGKENDKYSHFKTLESKGVLLLNAKKGFKKTEENKHWVFDEGLVYQHSIMLLNLEKKPSFNNNDVKLPKRYVSCAEVKRCFNEYKTKFETHTINVQGNEKKFCSIVSYKLFSDFVIEKIVDDISMLLVETWRTYMHTKLKSLSLKCFNDNMNYFNELLPDNNQTNKYNIGYSAHGTKIEKGKDVFIVYETKFNQPMKVFSKRPKKSTELIPSFKMMDAMLTNTLVLDERIQKLANNEYTLQDKNNTKISYSEIWNLMNVYIPKSDEIQLGVKEFDVSYSCKIYKLLDKYKNNTIKKFSFIIIHLGIIEKILVAKPNNSKNDTSIKKFLDELAQYSEAKIIITSGRAPQNLPNNYSFISYSLLSQYLIENRFKLYLNEVLNFSRPKI